MADEKGVCCVDVDFDLEMATEAALRRHAGSQDLLIKGWRDYSICFVEAMVNAKKILYAVRIDSDGGIRVVTETEVS